MKRVTLPGFIAELRLIRSSLPRTETRGLRFGAEIIRDEAKNRIGHENADWAPLAASTVKQKQSMGYTGRISATDPLYRTGDMRASIKATVQGHHAQVGSDLQVAIYQELGTSRMPARWFLGAAAFTKGRDAAKAAGLEVAKLIAGKPVTRD